MALIRFSLTQTEPDLANDDLSEDEITQRVIEIEDTLQHRVGRLLSENEIDHVFEPMDTSTTTCLSTGETESRVLSHVPYDSTDLVQDVFADSDIDADPVYETPTERAEGGIPGGI